MTRTPSRTRRPSTSESQRPEPPTRSRRPSISESQRPESSTRTRRSSVSASDRRTPASSTYAASYETTGSTAAAAGNAPFNVPRPNSSYNTDEGYSNVNYSGRQDPRYTNTNPPYNAANNPLSSRHSEIASGVTAAGYPGLADRFSTLSVNAGRHEGRHSGDPVYERDSEFRTASDMETHDRYKKDTRNRLAPAAQDLLVKKSGVSPRDKKQPPEAHLRIADAHDRVSRGHARYVIL